MKKRRSQWIFLIPLIFLFLMSFSTYSRFRSKRLDEKKLKTNEKEIQELLDAGFEREAMKTFDRMGEKTKEKLRPLYFRTLVLNLRYDQAESLLKMDSSLLKNSDNLILLSETYKKRILYPRSLALFYRYEKKMNSGLFKREMTALLKNYRIFPIHESFVDGWFHQIGIGKNAEGFYLLGPDGNRIDFETYEALKPLDQGFLCRRNGEDFLLDPQGKFWKIKQGIEEKQQKEKKEEKDKEGMVTVYKEGNLYGYRFRDQMIIKAQYLFASPVSSQGTAYVRSDKGNYMIRFLALENPDLLKEDQKE